ncbi:sulfotransferase [Alteromonas antoniana]|uniref:sulfotransferase n=1 Tax=Alteromonas antoniana TaxID=2803813 RepID=UPI001C441652|nr:sulfotransferase [Alteromonas antoniana]
MSEIKDDLQQLHTELNDALKLVSEFSGVSAERDVTLDHNLQIKETQSLLERCNEVVADEEEKPTIRLVHHFACTGGTLISKCIASQPNVYLLSEVHPTTKVGWVPNQTTFIPRDIITNLRRAGIPNESKLSEEIFEASILQTVRHLEKRGGELVLRAHTHSDYCTTDEVPEIDTLSRVLEPRFKLAHLVTIRNPIDSYLSLQRNGWVHFTPANFDEYCRRFLKFISPFNKSQIFKYEDFVSDPESAMRDITSQLELSFSAESLLAFDMFALSGDSGRKASEISPRSRHEVSEELRNEVLSSKHYKKISEMFGYEI